MVAHSLAVFPEDQFAGTLKAARAAFGSDCGYAAAMATAAVALASREHLSALRAHLTAAVPAATASCAAVAGQFTCAVTSACGTGACRFASGPAASPPMHVPAPPGRYPRPANHVHPGAGFGTGPAQAAFAAAVPFTVGVRLGSADSARAADAPAA